MLLALIAPSGGAAGFDIWAVVKAIAAIAAIILASRTLLRPVMRVVAQTEMREIFVAFSLLLVIGVSLAMQSVGLSMALGTFLAGVLLADSEYRYELRLDIEPVKGLLLGLFFIAVGMSVDLSLLANAPLMIVGLALLIVLTKMAILMGLGRLFKYSLETTCYSAWRSLKSVSLHLLFLALHIPSKPFRVKHTTSSMPSWQCLC